LLKALNYEPDLFHCNEGHAAFIGIERLRTFIQQKKFSFTHALEVVRATSLFTTHTPVPAGHDSFHEDLLRTYIPHYAGHLNITWDDFMNLGRAEENNPNEKFSLSILAARLSQEMNGVSKIHGRVTREMFLKLYSGFYPNELHISHVTNGIHVPTWLHDKWRELYSKYLDNDFINNQHDLKKWQNIYEVKDHLIWAIKQELRKELLDYIKDRLEISLTERQEDPRIIFQQITHLNNQTLTFGFARRFATYKRAHLLFTNPDRLAKLVNDPEKPVQFLFAGKAHPQDKAGQDLIKKIIEISKTPEFIGKILFIENYDMELASKMVQGCDVWINTPTRPLEASGTSGEKAVMNGVLNCSVLDGWWAEGYVQGAGWALKEDKTYDNQSIQDKLDAETLYNIIENQIKTLFYARNEDDIPHNWVQYMKKNIAEIAPKFTMNRMINDYKNNYYFKMYERSTALQKNNYELAKEIAGWKSKIYRIWDDIEISELIYPDSTLRPLKLGENFETKIILKNTSGLQAEDLGIEILFGQKEHDVVKKIIHQEELQLVEHKKNTMTFSVNIPANRAGVYDFVFRLFPKHPLLPHRQDFNLIRWI
jgi:glycogen phosphorylase/synthase